MNVSIDSRGTLALRLRVTYALVGPHQDTGRSRLSPPRRREASMSVTFDLVLHGGTIVNQDGRGSADIGIRGGSIAAIGDLSQAHAGRRVDCTGLHVLPGVIDSQVHFRERASTTRRISNPDRAPRSWAASRPCSRCPNTKPETTTPEALADKVRRGRARMHCDFAFWWGRPAANTAELRDPGAAAGGRRHQGLHGLVDRLAARGGRRKRRGGPASDSPPRRVPLRGRAHAARAQGLENPRRSPVASRGGGRPRWR